MNEVRSQRSEVRGTAPKRGEFRDFAHWVNCAQSYLRGHQGVACFDAKGRECTIGRDFMRARDKNAFPVSFHYW